MTADTINDIEKYTICLYREKYFKPTPIGSGILVCFHNEYYIISAHHIFDMEDELIKIENDPDEKGIQHDDMDGIVAKSNDIFFYINDYMEALTFTVNYNETISQPSFNEDTEWCVCRLSNNMIQLFRNAGKKFYNIQDLEYPQIESGTTIIISGYPLFAQPDIQRSEKGPIENYRSFKSSMIGSETVSDPNLFRVHFENNHAYNLEQAIFKQLSKVDGIAGMSGGGFWYEHNNKYIPIGIILKQDTNENFIEGYRLDSIIKEFFSNEKS